MERAGSNFTTFQPATGSNKAIKSLKNAQEIEFKELKLNRGGQKEVSNS